MVILSNGYSRQVLYLEAFALDPREAFYLSFSELPNFDCFTLNCYLKKVDGLHWMLARL